MNYKVEPIRFKTFVAAGIQELDQPFSDIAQVSELLMNLRYQDYGAMILLQSDLPASFFDLKTGLAGELLQKFSNYDMRLAIVGDFKDVTAKSLRDFILESNKQARVIFVQSVDEIALKWN